uniref:HECT-type E3 ubiquitin transferase n=1 Tax=Globisporangium ultimum (strain ATCC 200006 / CBS 805.95 / DAOM BR144) TaxID=431595 RepID=K3X0G7_GLOUD
MEIFVALLAVVLLLLLGGGLYLLRDRSRHGVADHMSRSFLARILLAESETMTRLDLERTIESDERWKCLVCEFSNALDKRTCILCGTKRSTTNNIIVSSNPTSNSVTSAHSRRRSSSGPIDAVDELRINKHHTTSLSQPQPQQNLRLSTLNPRQRYARKRKEWVRRIGADGTAYWTRQDLVLQPVMARRNSSFQSGSSFLDTTTSTMNNQGRPSSGYVTYLVRSSVHSEGRLTFAESTQTDAATTIGGYKIHASELELIDQVCQLPFPRKFAWFLERMGNLLKSWEEGRIKLSVHRDNILVESMEQLLGIQVEHIHFPLRIEFIGEVGIDAGGLQREWFSILFSKLLDDSLGLFMNCHRNNNSVAINPNSIECTADHLLYFRGIGRLVGRALLEGHVMQARLCLPILKHFLGVPITFSDLQYVDPEIYNSMKWIRENDDVDALELTFCVTEIRNERPFIIDLVPGGRDLAVTDANKLEYLHLKLRYLMLDRYAEQLQALSLGLFEVVPQENLMVFDYQELELVLCGLPEIDVGDWRKHTQVAPSFGPDSPLVEWFWEVITEFSEDERARFLQFCTGSSRVPVQGFKGLTSYDGRICPFALRPLPHQTSGFPKVHTCFNRVELPQYATKQELEDALITILEMDLTEFSEE